MNIAKKNSHMVERKAKKLGQSIELADLYGIPGKLERNRVTVYGV